jgi:hypothetical protein
MLCPGNVEISRRLLYCTGLSAAIPKIPGMTSTHPVQIDNLPKSCNKPSKEYPHRAASRTFGNADSPTESQFSCIGHLHVADSCILLPLSRTPSVLEKDTHQLHDQCRKFEKASHFST